MCRLTDAWNTHSVSEDGCHHVYHHNKVKKPIQMDQVTLVRVRTLEIAKNACHLNTLGCSVCTSFNAFIAERLIKTSHSEPLKIKIPSKNMRDKQTNTPIIHSVY
jgi:hypothetical protein